MTKQDEQNQYQMKSKQNHNTFASKSQIRNINHDVMQECS